MSKDLPFGGFRVVSLDDAHTADGFAEATGDLGADTGAFAEDRSRNPKCLFEKPGENDQNAEREDRHENANANENDERDNPCENATDKVYEPCPNEILNSFHIGDDASDQDSSTINIEERDGQMADMLLDPNAQICDKTLARSGKLLRKGVSGDALDEGSKGYSTYDQGQPFELLLVHYVIDKVTRRNGNS
ncbi:hypothetical protein HDF13_003765 [Edaphobacter lichenicola]|uniref:Uncharacterized protein n=1 Tax=Tunturiibacter gelidiferens TaxID=3069689 RepID=A0ACC5P3M4_9BACT|nr:hypothetical protein [Edaphobacter lichenicola]